MPLSVLFGVMLLLMGLPGRQGAFAQEATRQVITLSPVRPRIFFVPQFGFLVSTQEPHGSQPSNLTPPILDQTLDPHEESVADAILEIRQRLGGGITGHLGEIVPRTDADRIFRDEIELIKKNSHPNAYRANDVSTAPEANTTQVAKATNIEPTNIEAVRQIAAQLDQLASQLEDLGHYHSADALRSEAQKIRLSVR